MEFNTLEKYERSKTSTNLYKNEEAQHLSQQHLQNVRPRYCLIFRVKLIKTAEASVHKFYTSTYRYTYMYLYTLFLQHPTCVHQLSITWDFGNWTTAQLGMQSSGSCNMERQCIFKGQQGAMRLPRRSRLPNIVERAGRRIRVDPR